MKWLQASADITPIESIKKKNGDDNAKYEFNQEDPWGNNKNRCK